MGTSLLPTSLAAQNVAITDAAVIDGTGKVPITRSIAADTIEPRVKLGEGHFNALYALEELGMDRMETKS